MMVRKIDHFTQRYNCGVVAFSGTPDPFLNINRQKILPRQRDG